MFLNKKVQEQTEKRKRDRKAKVPNQPAASPRAGAAGAATENNKRKGAARGGPKTENEEQLLNVIDDLRNDLQLRDEEFSDQRAYLDKIKIQNEYLKAELKKV